MFNERARFRLHHPIPPLPRLVCAPDAEPNESLAGRVAAAFRRADRVVCAGPVWEPLLREKQDSLKMWLTNGDVRSLAADLAALGRSEAAQGFFGGAGQHRKCVADPAFAQLLAAWTYDKLLSLAEAVGAIRLELPETGSWGENIKQSAGELWARIENRLNIDLTPPDHVGGFLGIEAGDCIVQMRVIEAIYAAYRLRQLITTYRLAGRVCEIGGGAGLTAYYALLFGVSTYIVIDLPTVNAVQGYMLAGSKIGDRVALLGEPTDIQTLRILPPEAFASLPAGSIDILYNQDSFPEIEPGAASLYLRAADDLCIPFLLSINQEAHLPTSQGHQRSVPELVSSLGSYESSDRHRHWLRQGYVEELFSRAQSAVRAA